MSSLRRRPLIAALLLALAAVVPGGRAEAGSSGAGSGSGTGVSSGAPVATHSNATFHNPLGIGQQVPAATPSVNTATTGNQVSTPSSSLAISGSSASSSSQGANISTASSTANRVGTSSNGLPIGSPGSGPGSPENPY